MAFGLQTLLKSDVPACVQIYCDAFQNSHSLACWPRVPGVREWWENMFYEELGDPHAHFLKAVSKSNGKLAGFAKWEGPKKSGQEPDTSQPEWPADADRELCDKIFGGWARKHADLMGKGGHCYLEIVAMSPQYKVKGAGGLLLECGCSRADEEHVEAFLEASSEAVRFYEKTGFPERGRTDTWIQNERVKGTWYRNLFMIRPPISPAAGNGPCVHS